VLVEIKMIKVDELSRSFSEEEKDIRKVRK
jgi:hypothetical protein